MTLEERLVNAVTTLLDESFECPRGNSSWYTDVDPKAGILSRLEDVSSAAASTTPRSDGASIVAHVEHLRFSLELANRAL